MTLEVDNSGNPQAPGGGARIVRYTYSPDMLNRSSVHDTATGLTSYEPSPLNQYSSVGGMGYSYDYNFNLTAGEGFSGTYDAANRLVTASNSGLAASPEVELVYDGLGRCVKRTINGVATVLVYDEWKPIAEWDEWGYIEAWNVYGPGADEILLRHRVKVGYIRFHADANGNVSFLVDNDGRVIEKYSYDAFGKPKVTDWDGENARSTSHYHHRFLFQGREYIDEAGVYDYRNRFYHPGLGRFLQKDPTGFDAGDMNLFRYCGDDPVDGSDPTGLTNAQSQITPDRYWEMAKYMDSSYTLQGIFQDQTKPQAGMGDNAGGGPRSVSAESEGKKEAKPLTGELRRFNIPNAIRNIEEAENKYSKAFPQYPNGQAIVGALQRALKDGRIQAGVPSNFYKNNPMVTKNGVILIDGRARLSDAKVAAHLAHEGQHLADRNFDSPFGRERRAFDAQHGFGRVLGLPDRRKSDEEIRSDYGY